MMRIVTLAEQPELAGSLEDFPDAWPEFIFNASVSGLLYEPVVLAHPEYCLFALDPADPDPLRPVAKACAVPISLPGGIPDGLPSNGFDGVLLSAAAALCARAGSVGPEPADRVLCAIEVVVQRDRRGTGLSAVMLDAVRANARRLGHRDLMVPLRPNGKHEYPTVPLAEYVTWTRPDGLPRDPWLRVHLRAGGEIVALAPCSMTITGSLDQWRAWTGLPLTEPGPVGIPGGLAPLTCDPTNDRAVYLESNVWIRHRL